MVWRLHRHCADGRFVFSSPDKVSLFVSRKKLTKYDTTRNINSTILYPNLKAATVLAISDAGLVLLVRWPVHSEKGFKRDPRATLMSIYSMQNTHLPKTIIPEFQTGKHTPAADRDNPGRLFLQFLLHDRVGRLRVCSSQVHNLISRHTSTSLHIPSRYLSIVLKLSWILRPLSSQMGVHYFPQGQGRKLSEPASSRPRLRGSYVID